MALKDRLTNSFLDKAHKRWRTDINADVSDIVLDMKATEKQLVEKEKQNILLTWMMSLYSYDAERLQRDITKLLTLKPHFHPSGQGYLFPNSASTSTPGQALLANSR